MGRLSNFLRPAGFFLLAAAFALLADQAAYAQVDTGAVLGTVKDQSGAVIPGAKVTLTNEGTNFSIVKNTESDGGYIFTPVKIGSYAVTAEFQGFQKASHPHVTLNVQQQVVVDFSLVPGAVTQTVEVTAEVPLLQTQNSSVGQVVGTREVNNLPLNGRNFTFLAQLTAGVNVGQQETRGLNASGDFSANGNRPSQNNYLLDGIDNNIDVVDFLSGTAFVVLPAVDAIQEFKVQTNNYSAEIGRAGGAVLNATIKSGTNQLHGTVWEFLRNDKFDAADFFENAGNTKKGEFRQNQFGAAVGGPVYIPGVYNGKNKTFFFGDFEGTRIRQGTPQSTSVPTVAERNSGFTNFSDLLTQGGTEFDLLRGTLPLGTIFDPATTRGAFYNMVDPVSLLTTLCPTASLKDKTQPNTPANCTLAPGSPVGFVRDPFPGNMIPAGRLDANAIKLLNLYPLPTDNSRPLPVNYSASPVRREKVNKFDVRVDHNFSEKDQFFTRVSYFDDPQFKPGPFTGIADGGGFNQGDQIATSRNVAISETHSFSPSLINEVRGGFSGIHTGRLQPNGNTSGIPAQFGIQAIPQVAQNGGLPAFGIGGLGTIGSNAFLVSDEFNSTLQFTENLTKVYRSHTFKGGFEFQHIKFSTLQPPWSRGQFNFDGVFTSLSNQNDSSTGRAQLLLTPTASTVKAPAPTAPDFVGGADAVFASNIANTDNGHNYYGMYFQDDWKVTPKLTLNLGVRWDHFGFVEENFGAQANFLPGTPGSGAQYLIPARRKVNGKPDPLSASFINTLATDQIALVYSNNFALGNAQKTNFSPRFGFAYQVNPKWVARGGFGIFYGGFENRGYSPNIGENYPFQFSFAFFNPDSSHPISYKNSDGTTCATAATVETGFSCIPLQPTQVNASGLQLRGIQFNYITPYTQGFNLTTQYQFTPDLSLEVGYVASLARHLEVFPGSNESSAILPPPKQGDTITYKDFLPFRDFAPASSYAATEGSSYYHSLQVKGERRFANGLNFLVAYTWSKVKSDSRDLLNNFAGGYRAPYVPGFGIQHDYGLADFDIRQAFHFSGGYELPVGRGKPYLSGASGWANQIVGGWSFNWILSLQKGQPFTVNCNITTTAPGNGANFNGSSGTCYSLLVSGQNPYAGSSVDHYLNPAAFTNPAPATTVAQKDFGPLGGAPNELIGPGFHRFDLSLFKNFKTSEKTHIEFRTEFFNLTNHPNFSLPGFAGNGFTAAAGSLNFSSGNFGKITFTRDNPNDPRQIQFALKLYW